MNPFRTIRAALPLSDRRRFGYHHRRSGTRSVVGFAAELIVEALDARESAEVRGEARHEPAMTVTAPNDLRSRVEADIATYAETGRIGDPPRVVVAPADTRIIASAGVLDEFDRVHQSLSDADMIRAVAANALVDGKPAGPRTRARMEGIASRLDQLEKPGPEAARTFSNKDAIDRAIESARRVAGITVEDDGEIHGYLAVKGEAVDYQARFHLANILRLDRGDSQFLPDALAAAGNFLDGETS